MHTRYKDEAAGSHGFGTTDPTCLQGIRTGLQYLTGKEHQMYMPTINHGGAAWSNAKGTTVPQAYEVSGRGCMISRVRNIRSNMLTRYQVVAAWSHGLGTTDRNRSNMPTKYQDGAAGSHGFGTTDPTCLQGIRARLQDLTGSEHHIVLACRVSGQGCMISRVRTKMGLLDLTGKEHGFGIPD